MVTLNGVADQELTKAQKPKGSPFGTGWVSGKGVWSAVDTCAAGTYETYRKMRTNPTIAMARAAALGPIKAASHSYEAKDGVPDQWVQLVQDTLDPLWPEMIRNMLFAVDYGWQAFEIVWGQRESATVITKIKPLLQDITTILADEHGRFVGVRQNDVTIAADKAWLYTHDGEAGNLYGRSRHENVREFAWNPWCQTVKENAKFMAKGAGIIPMLRYVPGRGTDENGAEWDNSEIARRFLENMAAGKGVAHPFTLAPWAEDALRGGADIADMLAWNFTFLETRSGVGGEILDASRYYDALMMRGWLVPERVAIEGQHGTKAESESHTDVAVMVAEELNRDIVACVNTGLVDEILATNYGPSARGKVKAVASPLTDEERQFFRRIVESVMTNPSNIDVLVETTDVDALLDGVGWPKAKEIVNVGPRARETAVPPDPALGAMSRRVVGKYKRRK